ncbi:ankyrin [Colletotrichum eremochloae]|nr:ankyrin [Colletotrichum eremochloae]
MRKIDNEVKNEFEEQPRKDEAGLEEQDFEWRTPLHWAARTGKHEVVKLLIAKGANKEASATSDTSVGKTPLHLAVNYGHTDAVKTLIKLGVDRNVQDRSNNNYIALHLAVKNGEEKATPLDLAITLRQEDIKTQLENASI